MYRLSLPETDEAVEPAFADPDSCARWISQFQLTDIRLAHRTLSMKLGGLNRAMLPPLSRLKITELLRETVGIVQEGCGNKLVGKPLPLSDSESSMRDGIVSLWAEMATSYGHCLNAGIDGEPSVAGHLARICQRCLHYTALQISGYIFLSHQVDSRLWLQLHRLYRISQDAGVSTVPVLDRHLPPTSCADQLIRAVLISQADPYELTHGQLHLVNRWLEAWTSLVTIAGDIPASAKTSQPIAIDLESPDCISHRASRGADIRYLDMSELGKNLKIKMVLLQQGRTPSELGLGESLPPDFCLSLIEKLHRHWCEGKAARGFEAGTISHRAELCFGLEDVHFHLSGKLFAQLAEKGDLNKRQHEEIGFFGHIASKDEHMSGRETESWNIQDEDGRELSLIRVGKGERVSPGHLVGIRGDEGFAPGVIRWVIAGLEGGVNMGLKLLEGSPEAVVIRQTGINLTVSGKYAPAILLHHGEGTSLVMPRGWYVRNRIIAALDSEGLSMEFRLTGLAGKGADYERATFMQI